MRRREQISLGLQLTDMKRTTTAICCLQYTVVPIYSSTMAQLLFCNLFMMSFCVHTHTHTYCKLLIFHSSCLAGIYYNIHVVCKYYRESADADEDLFVHDDPHLSSHLSQVWTQQKTSRSTVGNQRDTYNLQNMCHRSHHLLLFSVRDCDVLVMQ